MKFSFDNDLLCVMPRWIELVPTQQTKASLSTFGVLNICHITMPQRLPLFLVWTCSPSSDIAYMHLGIGILAKFEIKSHDHIVLIKNKSVYRQYLGSLLLTPLKDAVDFVTCVAFYMYCKCTCNESMVIVISYCHWQR